MGESAVNDLSWIDLTSLGILIVFLILGFFRGFLWQMSRLVSLLLGWVLAESFSGRLAMVLDQRLDLVRGRIAIYISYFTIFIAVLIVLSFMTILLEKFIKKLELSFFDRLGGGLMGAATGAGLLLALLGITFAFFGKTALAQDARESHTGRISRKLVRRLKPLLSTEILELYEVPGRGETSEGDGDGGK